MESSARRPLLRRRGARDLSTLWHRCALSLDDVILRPVARLLFTAQLLGDGSASTVDSFALGPAYQGRRRWRASWTPPRVYTNEPDPSPLSVDGTVTGM